MSDPVAVWTKLNEMEQAHAELAAKVADFDARYSEFEAIANRMASTFAASLESPAPAPDPVCAGPKETDMCTCHHNYGSHWGIGGACLSYDCKCQSYNPTAEPEPAPLDPVLVITVDFLEDGDGYLRTEIAGILRDALNRDEEVLGMDAAWRISTEVLAKILTYGRDGAR